MEITIGCMLGLLGWCVYAIFQLQDKVDALFHAAESDGWVDMGYLDPEE